MGGGPPQICAMATKAAPTPQHLVKKTTYSALCVPARAPAPPSAAAPCPGRPLPRLRPAPLHTFPLTRPPPPTPPPCPIHPPRVLTPLRCTPAPYPPPHTHTTHARASCLLPPRSESELNAHFAKIVVDEEKNAALKDLKTLQIVAAKEVDVGGGRKACLIYVPPPQLAKYRPLQKTLVEMLEKKMSSTHSNVIILANRTMVSSEEWARSKKHSGLRPRNRSLKVVQEAILDDLVFPSEITGKRVKVRAGGERLLSIQLGHKDKDGVFDRKDIIESVYKALTTKAVTLEGNF
jgi:small subunit ribosomal protein S7e